MKKHYIAKCYHCRTSKIAYTADEHGIDIITSGADLLGDVLYCKLCVDEMDNRLREHFW